MNPHPYPKIGSTYVKKSENPFKHTTKYKVGEIKRGWVRLVSMEDYSTKEMPLHTLYFLYREE